MSADRLRALFVAGTGRSGTTILARALGRLDGAFPAGELCHLGGRGLAGGHWCGCGEPVPACAVWRRVLARAFPNRAAEDVGSHLAAHQRRLGRARNAGLLASRRGWPALRARAGDMPDHLGALLRALAEVTGCSLVVDTSKPLVHGFVLASVPGLELAVVHLVRDPRATAFSLQRLKPPDIVRTVPPLRSALVWSAWNAAAPALARHPGVSHWTTLRYEDFAAAPRRSLEGVVAGLGWGLGVLPFIDDHTLDLAPDHTVAGNADRHSSGHVRVVPDDEWMSRMSTRDRATVSVATAVLRRRYGYPWSPSPA